MQNFENQQQLEEYLFPVLNIRKKQLQELNIEKSEQEIFENLRDNKWKFQKNLYLHEIVDDILHYEIETEVNTK